MDLVATNVDSQSQTKDVAKQEGDFKRWLSQVLGNIRYEITKRAKIILQSNTPINAVAVSTQQALWTGAILGGSLKQDDKIRLIITGVLNYGSGGTKYLKLFVNSTAVVDTTAKALVSGNFYLDISLHLTTSNILAVAFILLDGVSPILLRTSNAFAFTASLTLTLTTLNADGNASAVVIETIHVEIQKAPQNAS